MTRLAEGERSGGPRRLPLRGAVNCRDLGGYATRDGRQVRWGRLFRSDSLAELDPTDLAQLDRLGLHTVVDLRAPSEREHKPNRALPGPPRQHAFGFMPHRGDELIAQARAGTLTVAQVEARVREIYTRFVTEQAPVYARLLQLMHGGALPLLFHCTSGRDRTGFASAVVLMALGVPRHTIAEDYALSNAYRRDLTFQLGHALNAEVMAALTQSHPGYLAAAFAAIDEHWGDETTYLREALGLTAQDQATLQAHLLEPLTPAAGPAAQATAAPRSQDNPQETLP